MTSFHMTRASDLHFLVTDTSNNTDPEHPKHAQWVTCLVSIHAMQELECFQLPGIVYRSLHEGPCIIMLQHDVMVVDEWQDNGPQDLVTVSLCIQTAISKMHLCSLSVAYACPYHNPTTTMGLFVHNISISKPLAHTTPHAVCHLPNTVKTGILAWREHFSKVPDTIEGEHLATQVSYDDELQLGQDPDEDDEYADELSWDVCAEIIWLCKPTVASAVQVAGLRQSCRWRSRMWSENRSVVFIILLSVNIYVCMLWYMLV